MTAPHFFASSVESDLVEIRGDDARHGVRVLRITPGETITVSDGAGNVVEAKVTEAGAFLGAEVFARRHDEQPRPSLIVFQGIPKQGKLSSIVQDLVEVGVDRIVPVRTARSVPKWDAAKAAARLERWRTVAREAAMQSRRSWLPQIDPVASLGDVPPGTLVLHEEAIRRLSAALVDPAPAELWIAVGPEGGFDPAEVAAMEDAGSTAVSLGKTILRTETAAVVAAALALGRYGRLG